MKTFLCFCLALCLLVWSPAAGAAIVSGFDSNVLQRNDDGSAGPVPLGFSVGLFGNSANSVFVNNNGNVTVDAPLGAFTPFNLLQTNQLIIAPFFADVDTRAAGDAVTFGSGSYEGRPAFGVNWINVDYYFSSPNHSNRNSFQLIIVSRSDRGEGDFDIVFNYDQIRWESGEFSGGNSSGLGGSSARAGYALGRGAPGSAFELPGSAVNGALLDNGPQSLIRGSRGSTVPGRYIFEIRGTQDTQVSALTPNANAPSVAARSDASGNFVVFESRASNLVNLSEQNPGADIFFIDTRTGTIETVSVDNDGAPISGDAREPAVSQDGALVTFVAPDAAVRALLNEPLSKRAERIKGSGAAVFLRNMQTGTTQRVGNATTTGTGTQPQPSAGGTHVIYTGVNTDPSQGSVGQQNVFLAPITRLGDEVGIGAPRCVSCKSVAANGSDTSTNSNGTASNPAVNQDGTVVTWQTTASNPLAGTSLPCSGASSTVMMRFMQVGTVRAVSGPGNGGSCGSGGSAAPQIDSAGEVVVFESDQPLTAGDSNALRDIYVYSVSDGTLSRASETSGGTVGNGASSKPDVSGDGKVVAFVSAATNLGVDADTNGVADIHVKSLSNADTARLSRTDTGQQSDGAADRPGLNFDGSRIVFDSTASNMAPGSVGGLSVIYQRANPLVSGVLKSATWWKSDESGWGLFIFDQGNLLAPAWFTYDTDGEPTWFLAGGAFLQPDGSYVGDLFRFTGVPLAQISGIANDPPTQVGNVVLRFSGDTGLSFQYTVNGVTQTKQMTRFPFGQSTVVCRASPTASRAAALNVSDIWWGGAQTSGWGLFINQVDDLLFAIWYTYDTDREPLFLVISTIRQPGGSFSGQVFRQRNGTPFSMINGAPASPGNDVIGSATFRFTDGENGTFSYNLNGGVNQSKPITRLQVGNQATVCNSEPAGR
ncbi:nidogen-like domain-containing protein [Pseudomarimonas arenosa]|uniref:NIDO domain-containing protein n=1 Tax=Pseudomarimonas arenosa TaxID=2774145 RepID=A0AAW3ZHT9_9GAMM|nr:nidogen-like domain-containing protein [Pseudomarimonas arenosa]MBD8524552.1 hypothetical protein [Pseudomarimonas arenosa]